MTLRQLTRLAGLALCVLAFCGTASAQSSGGERGNSSSAPGQERKADHAQSASSESQSQQSVGAEVKAKVSAKTEAKAQAEAAQATEKSATAQAKVAAKAAVKATVVTKVAAKQAAKAEIQAQPSGRSAEAHHHVIVCHRTGSDSNPYVVINIPTTAWHEAHSDTTGKHPPKSAREDKLLKDPASRPGSKDGFTKQSSCGAAPAVVQATAQESDVCPNIAGMQTTLPAGTVKHGNGACVETKAEVTVTAQPTVTEVAAVQTTAQVKAQVAAQVKAAKAQAKAQAKAAQQAQVQPASGGVLGAVASAPEAIEETATSGTLPFTGIPLWFTVLLGTGLLLTGLALRRAAQH